MLRPMSGSTRPTAGVGNGSGVGVVAGDSVGVGEGAGVAVAFGGVGATVTFVRFGVGVRVGVACGIGVDVGLSVGEGVGDSANVGDGGATSVGETSLVQPLPTTSRTEAVAAVSNKRSGDLPKMCGSKFHGNRPTGNAICKLLGGIVHVHIIRSGVTGCAWVTVRNRGGRGCVDR